MDIAEFEKELDGYLAGYCSEANITSLTKELSLLDKKAIARVLAKSYCAHKQSKAGNDLAGYMLNQAIPGAKKAQKFDHARRPKGSTTTKTNYIRSLAIANPNKKAQALFLEADKSIIGEMSEGTFANHITKGRKHKK
jgi:hypothetical protein